MEAEARTVTSFPANPARMRDEGAEMLARHLDGDLRAFPELVDRFGGQVYGYLRRSGMSPATADDLFQETFMRVHRSAAGYNPDNAFKAWLFTIAHNLVRSHYRKKQVRRVMVDWWHKPRDPGGEPEPMDPPDPSPDTEQQVAARERIDWLRAELPRLPEGPRRALMLTQVDGLSQEDAARILKIPVPTLKTWLRRGRLALADALARHEKKGETR